MKDPMSRKTLLALLNLAAADATGVAPKWTPDGRSLLGLQARGLAHPLGLTAAGREVAVEILGLARLDPGIREGWMREVRQIFGVDDELIEPQADGARLTQAGRQAYSELVEPVEGP